MLPFSKLEEFHNHGKLYFAAFLLFILTLFMGTIPVHVIEWYSNRNKRSSQMLLFSSPKRKIFTQERIQQFLAQLGGGVLLYTAFIHMLPEIRENYETYLNGTTTKNSTTKHTEKEHLPLVDLCACAGFFGIFLVEEVMHTFFLKHHDDNDSDNQEMQSIDNYYPQFDNNNNNETGNNKSVQINRSVCSRIFDAFLLILAFSCHSVFDGISIGVQNGSRVWTVLIAILSHKLLISFIISVQIYEQSQKNGGDGNSSRRTSRFILWFFMVLFASMSPVGIFIVLISSANAAPGEQQLHIIVLAAISAGTIIYICFLEIIDKRKTRKHISGFIQWIALILGFSLMHLVASCFPEE